MIFRIEMEGQDQIKAALAKFGKVMEDELQKATFAGATIVKSHVDSNLSSVGDVTGNLKRASVVRDMPRMLSLPIVSICAMDEQVAPHAHLVEYGTVPRTRKNGGYTGQMPSKPFFRPAEAQSRGEVQSMITERIAAAVERFEGEK